MQYHDSQKGLRRVAVVLLAAFAMCAVCSAAAGVVLAGDKTRNHAERALHDGDYETAEKLYRELLEKNTRDTDARLGLSYALLKRRHLQDSFDHAARVIAVDPLNSRAHALIGAAVLAAGDFRLSVEEFRTALSIRENETLAIAGLAMVDFYENRLTSSINGLRRAVYLDPDEPDYLFNLAQAAARTERFKEAADAYERFLVVAPHTDADRRARIRGLIDFMRYLGQQSSLYVQDGESHVALPFEIVNNRPVIQVRLNGSKEVYRFVLDTGSGMAVISESTAQRLGVRPVARGGDARAVGGAGRFEIVYGFLSSIEMGEARVENVPVYIRRFFDEGDKPVDGYVGLSIIAKYITTVDYGTQTFSLVSQRDQSKNPAQRNPNSIDIPIRTTSSGFLSGEVLLEGIKKPLNFILDTGASVSVIAEKLAISEEMDRFLQTQRMTIYGAAGVADDVKMLMLPSVKIGPHLCEKIPAAVLDLEPINETTGFTQNGIIGGNFLRQFRVTFNFVKGVVTLEPLIPRAPGGEKRAPEGEASARKL
ncbi:MAG TPA: aspartyl protease family protein [Pyrinomonadaceae bacterium]|jgi:predicted aspartyl protease/Flp pilus assembly protein TadD|nr:aspartyl protease family protein [Pyrinomonadaceae bacterium]